MSFLAPLFLFGALALAAPVLLHLRRRRAKTPQPFPSLMFLENVPVRSVKRRRLRDVALLVARCAALLLLALTFAQPIVPSLGAGSEVAAGEQVVLLLDRSFSMSHGGRWERALAAVSERLAVAGDRVSLVGFGRQAEVLLPWTVSEQAPASLLSGLRPGVDGTDYGAAVRAARRLVNQADTDRPVRVVLVTDVQAGGWDRSDRNPLPAGVELELLDVRQEPEPANLAVLGVRLERQQTGDRERVVVTARVGRFSPGPGTDDEPGAAIPARLELQVDEREVETLDVSIDPAEPVFEVEFQPFTVASDREHRGAVALSAVADSIGVDDVHRFVMAPGDALSVLLVEPPGRRSQEAFYLRRALQTLSDPRIRLESAVAGSLQETILERADVTIVLDAIADLQGGESEALLARIGAGAGLLVSVGPRTASALASADAFAALPEGLRPPAASERRGGSDERQVRRLASLSTEHPSFRAFSDGFRDAFTGVAFFRAEALEPRAGDRVLAYLDDGAPLLVERPVGRGRIHWYATSLDASWSDLPLHNAYVPWLDGEVRTLAGYRPRPPSYRIGEVAELALPLPLDAWTLEAPSGDRSPLGEFLDQRRAAAATLPAAATPTAPDADPLASADQALMRLDQPGFWELSTDAGEAPRLLATNVDAAESDFGRLDADEFAAGLVTVGEGPREAESAGGVAGERSDAPRGRLWWALAVATLAALCVEGVLASVRQRRDASSGAALS